MLNGLIKVKHPAPDTAKLVHKTVLWTLRFIFLAFYTVGLCRTEQNRLDC